ncbi:MAG: hypothetical protein NC935_06115 [Candidatus Omnitrophica bacterium]|nr:hypothetical protein [Candidatus Omnitrophota bacterium]
MNHNDDKIVEKFILDYHKKVYSLIVYLIKGDQNKAYDICVDSFVEAFNLRSLPNEKVFFIKLLKIAIQKSRNIKTIPSKEVLNSIAEIREYEKNILFTIFEALLKLDFEDRALLLLRYQLNLTNEEISKILDLSLSQIRYNLVSAYEKLNKAIKSI